MDSSETLFGILSGFFQDSFRIFQDLSGYLLMESSEILSGLF